MELQRQQQLEIEREVALASLNRKDEKKLLSEDYTSHSQVQDQSSVRLTNNDESSRQSEAMPSNSLTTDPLYSEAQTSNSG